MLRVIGQHLFRHRPGARNVGVRSPMSRLLLKLVSVLPEPREVLVDASLGLPEICGGVVESDGQMTKLPPPAARARSAWRASSSSADCRVSCATGPDSRGAKS